MATSLSEKAKGKQRATDPPSAGQGSLSAEPVSRDLTIRFTEGGSDLIVHVDKKDTVKDVKQKVFRPPCALNERLTSATVRSEMYGQSCKDDACGSYILVDCSRMGHLSTPGSRRLKTNNGRL